MQPLRLALKVDGGVDQWHLFPFQRAIMAGLRSLAQFDLDGQKPASVVAGQHRSFYFLFFLRQWAFEKNHSNILLLTHMEEYHTK